MSLRTLFTLTLVLCAAYCTADAFDERVEDRDQLVEYGIVGAGIEQPEVIEAMRTVPRHRYVPDHLTNRAYLNRALPIGHGQTISQPYIVAYMTEALELTSESRVLEIGTGSGYQASVLAEITPHVYTIEIIPELAESARERLDNLGYDEVISTQGDGYYGWEEHAPYDTIIVTAAADHVPPPLIQQLAPGGIMIIPVGQPMGVQTLIRIKKRDDGRVVRDGLLYVRFVPLTGEH